MCACVLHSRKQFSVLNFHKLKLNNVMYISLMIQIPCGPLIKASVSMNKTCCISFVFLRTEVFSLWEIIAFQRIKMNILALQLYPLYT